MMGPSMEVQTFDRLTLFGRRWFFRIVDTGNWEKLAQSEPYNSAAKRDKTATRLSRALACAVIPERKKR